MMGGKNLAQKLKLGLAGLVLTGSNYFNSANAQENYLPKYNTIAHKMLMIEDSGIADFYHTLKKLDEVIDSSKTFITKKNYTKQELSELSKKIHSTINYFDSRLDNYMKEGWFVASLTGEGSLDVCYRYSLYYLAIGEENKIPFHMIEIPKDNGNTLGHVFIRYDPDGKHSSLNLNSQFNKEDVNIEATTKEIEDKNKWTDKYYINKYLIPYEAIDKNSLRSLNKQDLLAIAYCQKAKKNFEYTHKRKKEREKEIKKAIEECDKSTKNHPFYGYKIPLTKDEKDSCLKKINIEKSKESIEKEYKESIEKTLEDCNKALKLSPNNFAAFYYKGEIYKRISGIFGKKADDYFYASPRAENFKILYDSVRKESNFYFEKSIENFIKAAEIIPDPNLYSKIASYYCYSWGYGKEYCCKDILYISKAIDLTKKYIKNERNSEKLNDQLERLENNKEDIIKNYKYASKICNCEDSKK